MLSAIIIEAADPVALAATLSSLVPAAVEGVLREVVVVDGGGSDMRRVADHAGCRVETLDELVGGAERLKGEWTLVLRSGVRLGAEWVDLAALHIATAGGDGGRLDAVGRDRRGWWRALVSSRGEAILVPKAHLVSRLRAARSFESIGRGLRIRSLRER